ncbi:molybdopterin-dependent oxidoreductase [Streptomyces sp. NBC_00663]|uniref:hypothetical protein n=1 Tax=Streptomyces sp. NBC_00663 TaxID=2975801 RepID=UPI002E3679DE|nr:hypothetical protein [Streptomyces sp. NBC_00663]
MSQPLAAARTTAGPAAELVLAGDLTRPSRLTVPDLPAWPQHRTEAALECATSGIQHHTFTGPLLYDVLTDAGPVFDPARRKDRLRFLIAVRGATPLDRAGPQLVLPQDRCGARYISGIEAVHVDGGYTAWSGRR